MKRYIRGNVHSTRSVIQLPYTDRNASKIAQLIIEGSEVANKYVQQGFDAVCYAICLAKWASKRKDKKANFEYMIGVDRPLFAADTLDDYYAKVEEFCNGEDRRMFNFYTVYNKKLGIKDTSIDSWYSELEDDDYEDEVDIEDIVESVRQATAWSDIIASKFSKIDDDKLEQFLVANDWSSRTANDFVFTVDVQSLDLEDLVERVASFYEALGDDPYEHAADLIILLVDNINELI